jgi:hypothetical protein
VQKWDELLQKRQWAGGGPALAIKDMGRMPIEIEAAESLHVYNVYNTFK